MKRQDWSSASAAGTIHRPPQEQLELMADLTGDDVEKAEAAFDVIYGDYRSPLLQKAAGLLVDLPNYGAVADPENMVQDVFASMWEKRTELNDQCLRIYTWLQTNLWRRAMNELRNARNRATEVMDMSPAPLDDDEEESQTWEPIDESPSPIEHVERNDEAALVQEALESALNERERRAFLMRYSDDVPIKEIAAVLKMKPNTVKSSLSNSRKKLRAWLEPRIGR